ncbi:hypothetical protein EG329_014340 [Mollisiaceae sp. DMI_Dod_QoI]|nr:hypothetical protein EG329_014340 [Helotiales sp. DMI_Dod_QoI]
MAYHAQGRSGRSNSDSSTANAMTTTYAARPRKRTAHACDACRLRKSRSHGKSDQILETVLRMDGLLRSIHENFNEQHIVKSISSPRFSDPSSPNHRDFAKVANATIPSTHISATQDLLSGSFAAPFPSLRAQFRPIFLLESASPPIHMQPRSIRPVFTTDEAERLLTSFQRNVNFWYRI